ncbi:uncharacterized protein AC631_04424 [Debaryomyces fabryi]|uniref:Uncharacterized protein n=1 Tax=Debaryomyces fabryi TaxID=58627 RepID=A0A0V1PUS8_9ASCO|nr:uncharacterized protein AC631_04424 [Debaryomyces fabryi]KRZ99828.1 hypothetical protein AC631_04424 [Debaryomyces fabryi]CUM47869.1 unnamed protein product [Debaryomyces fabryi]
MEGKKDLTLEQLHDQVQSLSKVVEMQSQLIAKTGKQLMDIQVKDVKSKMNADTEKSSSKAANVDMDDYATNEDIIQLVGELQGQLDMLEDRNIRRTINSHLSSKDKDGLIAPIANKDGDDPQEDVFPATIGDLLSLSKYDIVQLCEFYELVIPMDQQEHLKEFLENNNEMVDMEGAKRLLEVGADNATLKERVEAYSDKQIDELFDILTRFIGVRARRSESAW